MATVGRIALSVCIFAMGVLGAGDGLAQFSRSVRPRSGGFGSSVAVGPDGTVHILYCSPKEELRHSWLEGKHWMDEVVDPVSTVHVWCDATVDSQGRVHVAYRAEPTVPGMKGRLSHAVREGTGWIVTDLGPGGVRPSIAIGPEDLPRILHLDGAVGARFTSFNGATWNSVDVGVPVHTVMPTSLIIDTNGFAHATFGLNTQLYYGTNASGSWVGTPLGAGGAYASIALDPAGRPQVLAAYNSGVAVPSLQYLWFDGSSWQSETLFDSSTKVIPDYVDIAADGDGGLIGLFSAEVPSVAVALTFATYFDGVEWRVKRVDLRNAGLTVSAARAPDGTLHGTYTRAGRSGQVLYARVRLPDLKASWAATSVTTEGGGKSLQGTLRIRNEGAARSKAARVTFYLSDDDVLDPDDEQLDYHLSLGATGGGQERLVSVDIGPILPGGGTRVLAVIDADRRITDTNRLNNTAAVVLFP